MSRRKIQPLSDDEVELKREPTLIIPANQMGLEEYEWGMLLNSEKQLKKMGLKENPNAIKRKVVAKSTSVSDIDDFSDEEEIEILPTPKLTKQAAIAECIEGILNGSDDDVVEVPQNNKKQKGQGRKAVRWCCTWNNPRCTGEELEELLKTRENVKGFAFQTEVGENGTKHFQMYLEFTSAVYNTAVMTALNTRSIATFACNGSKAQCVAYCTKNDTRVDGPWVYGTCADGKPGQGRRTDIDILAAKVIEAGGLTSELMVENPGMVAKYAKGLNWMMSELKYKRAQEAELEVWKKKLQQYENGEEVGQEQRHLIFFFGPSGVGKTTLAKFYSIKKYGKLPFMKSGETKWWDKYDDEDVVLVDEWRKELGSVEAFNDMTNDGPKLVEFKGGYISLIAKCMLFTSNRHPLHIFDAKWADARFRALTRRFAEVHWWNDNHELTVLVNPGVEPEQIMTDEWEEWGKKNLAWLHFWKKDQRPIREGDNAETLSANYFTW